ncbi:hypothetical protein GCM10011588_31690 [Nocardia jinanensis]|uniref:Uncharacterized protein n=1 Tax=Nocardia jinanensis TaxID=382504 RepID=A0A917VT08_9NOCA|nr:hypothetical protein GCM10011588_31690 [Nocardia jinanensis]
MVPVSGLSVGTSYANPATAHGGSALRRPTCGGMRGDYPTVRVAEALELTSRRVRRGGIAVLSEVG